MVVTVLGPTCIFSLYTGLQTKEMRMCELENNQYVPDVGKTDTMLSQ